MPSSTYPRILIHAKALHDAYGEAAQPPVDDDAAAVALSDRSRSRTVCATSCCASRIGRIDGQT